MSLNRFYLADGVRLYSQETWKLHVPDGKERLERNISSVAAWYLKCLDEDNHVVRESAALAIGELVSKLSEESVRPSLPLIQESVKAAFYDESWPVRDRALVCLSVIAGRFGCDDEDVWGLMWGNLGDQIWSVRDNAGWGIGEWLKGMPAGAERDKKLEETKAKFEELAQKAKEEPKRSRKDVQNEVNDKAAHTNNQLYSCGSLAPKLHKSANRVTGCSDCMVLRPTRQWERTDGAAYLLGHLASSSLLPDAEIVEMLKALVDATRHEIYVEHETLKATVMKVFSKIVEAKESKVFKRHYCNLILSCITRWISTGGSGEGIGNLMVFEGENCLEKVRRWGQESSVAAPRSSQHLTLRRRSRPRSERASLGGGWRSWRGTEDWSSWTESRRPGAECAAVRWVAPCEAPWVGSPEVLAQPLFLGRQCRPWGESAGRPDRRCRA